MAGSDVSINILDCVCVCYSVLIKTFFVFFNIICYLSMCTMLFNATHRNAAVSTSDFFHITIKRVSIRLMDQLTVVGSFSNSSESKMLIHYLILIVALYWSF